MNKQIVIVGLGLIGGSLAKAFQERTDCTIIGMDVDDSVLKAAVTCGAIDRIGTDGDLKNTDMIFLCTYPQAAVDFVTAHSDFIPHDCIVTDTCGIKTAICAELTALSKQHGFVYVGGHPMAGKEKNGFSVSEASLFDGASYIIIPCDAPDWAVNTMKEVAATLGFGGTVLSTPEHHDAMIAFTSQLPHVLACSYVMSPCCPQHNGFSAGSYRDVSRVARINEQLWTELFLDNRAPLVTELNTLIENITRIKNAVEQNDHDALQDLLRQGREIKERLGE